MRLITAILCLLVFTSVSHAFALLGFPSVQSVEAGDVKCWVHDNYHLSLSYSISSNFLSHVDGANNAAVNALDSWGAISLLDFEKEEYEPIVNSLDNYMAGSGAWEGTDGLGANIDIYSAGSDFSFVWGSYTFGFGNGTLAFAQNLSLSGNLISVDIVLNESYDWYTDGINNFDIESVLAHEIGHALGLDHTDQALPPATNYSAGTYQVDAPYSSSDLMNSGYYPDGINRVVAEDDRGGIRFLYGPYPGDFDGDDDVDGADFLIWQIGYSIEDGALWYEGDADLDGDVDGSDFLIWQSNYPYKNNTSQIPEPCVLFFSIICFMRLLIKAKKKVII